MKTTIFFTLALILVGFAQFEDPRHHIQDIKDHARYWFERSSAVNYSQIIQHSEQASNEGGKVCYRAIHVAYVDVVCLGWDNQNRKIKHVENYRIMSK